MEIADIFVINKSDRDGAEHVEREIRSLQSLAMRHDGWTPPIVKTVASQGVGIKELASAVSDYEAYLQKENLALPKSVENWQERLSRCCATPCWKRPERNWGMATWHGWRRKVAEHKRDPYTLVEEIARTRGKADWVTRSWLKSITSGLQ